ncbi:5-bromo-4-chloroindolyl phosphate hydrolysis family protein [Latilactobacillus fuchuensis]|jgi:5-bromo-4-chloroindolyl phosphate hydrolysis protein|uniref:5-bromo-4-chloroindolyl phosphate hydrolysis family protein n=1 Tax=Latilactobacillus fuchuensis DSM 14340 = JCM 11249 TaxID=1423747 RepID=A0A0R1RWG1_9LACO|nr:5-bromo-4-chloroindolyl phosphate hydrolysis family protein [Latilactobacillus fuchuensis]KRL58594.1 hypothetical protein FC69_GL000246 [Latilactobacillus fuchuensis DSM 14340 = JCM 11249]
MQYLIQYRQSQLLKISTIVVLAVLMLNRSVSFALFLLVGLVLQWLFNVRRAWGLYTPIVTGCLLVLLPRTDALDNYTVLPILLLVLVLASLFEGGLYLWRRVQTNQFAQQINQSGQTKQLMISDRLLKESGLTDEERSFFKREIKKSYEQLTYLKKVQVRAGEYSPTAAEDIRIINLIFNELLGAPRQILNVSEFLYDHLPQYVRLTRSILSLSNNAIQTEEDQQQFEQAQTVIATLSGAFEQDYLKVTEDERKTLKRQINS